ncbi:MAG TPA: response regulator [Nitrososphaeraceae archaeon]
MIRNDNMFGPVGDSRSDIIRNTFFQIDRDRKGTLSAIDTIGANSAENISYEDHNSIKSNLSAIRVGLQTKKILIVDDNPDIVFTLRSVFEEYPERFQISTYTNPMEVLSTFQTDYYDLALIDINMPILNGFQLCEKLVDLDANLRVCFMSGGEMNQDAIREIYPKISIGCFIKKPIGAGELIERVISQLA